MRAVLLLFCLLTCDYRANTSLHYHSVPWVVTFRLNPLGNERTVRTI